MANRNNQDLSARRPPPADAAVDIHPAVGRFRADVDALVDEHLTDDEIEVRLERVRRDVARSAPAGPEWSFENALWRDFAQRLAQDGYRIVRIWMRIVLVWTRAVSAIAGHRADLTEDDVNELAQETVARAINSFRDQARRSGQWPWEGEDATELMTTFLTECVRQLPHTYRSRLLETERLPVDRLEELAGHQVGLVVLRALRHCVTDRRDDTAHLLQSWSYTGQESNEIIEMTLRVLDLAARRYPEMTDPQTTFPPHGDQAVER